MTRVLPWPHGTRARAEDSLSTGSSSTAEFLRREGRVVRNLQEAYQWAEDALAEIMENEGIERLEELADQMGHDTITTAFSGIEAPIVSMNCLHVALQDALNR